MASRLPLSEIDTILAPIGNSNETVEPAEPAAAGYDEGRLPPDPVANPTTRTATAPRPRRMSAPRPPTTIFRLRWSRRSRIKSSEGGVELLIALCIFLVIDVPTKEETPSQVELVAQPEEAGQRLDRWLAAKIAGLSRARAQALIRSGHISAGGTIRELRAPVKPGVTYTVTMPPAEESGVRGEDIPLAILHEDDDIVVLDKPAGLVVHPSAGHEGGTLVNALIAHCGQSLSGIGGVKRPGIVHRLDKDTSGVLVVAKSDAAHQGLAEQFKSHGLDGRLHRSYLAFVWGRLQRPAGLIEARLGRSRTNRLKIAVTRGEQGREARTHYEVVDVFPGETPAGDISLLRLVLETGRTHQIRVHLAHIGHPVVGDPTYGAGFKTRIGLLNPTAKQAVAELARQALHAERLEFEHPASGKKMNFYSKLPAELERLGEALAAIPKRSTDKRRRSRL